MAREADQSSAGANRVGEGIPVSEIQLKGLFEHSNDSIILHDLEGRILAVNQRACEVLGYSRASLTSMRVGELHPEEALATSRQAFEHIVHEGEASFEIEFLQADGTTFVGEVSASRFEAEGEVLVQGIIRDVSERKRVERELRISEERNRAVLDSALDCIISVDREGRVIEFNPAAEEIFGYLRDDVVGQQMAPLIMPPDFHAAHQAGMERYLSTGNPKILGQRLELSAVRANGTEFPVELTVTATERGESQEFTAYIRDITDRKKAERELQQAKEAAELANAAKSDLLASVSHELRTPLNVILGMSELVAEGGEAAERDEYLDAIRSNAEGLVHLINDLVEFTRIEAGQILINVHAFDPRRLLADVVRSMSHRAREQGLELRADAAPSLPSALLGDGARIRQILLNLTSNALHYTREGSVSLRLDGDELEDGSYLLELEVADTGIGIEESEQEKVFEKFYQATGRPQGPHRGTGLGLSICRSMVEMMQGSIDLWSRPGEGSRLTIKVPLKLAGRDDLVEVYDSLSDVPNGKVRHRSRILLVEDNPDNRRVLCRFLELEGHTVDTAEDGSRGVEKALGGDFDLILMDLEMPVLNGLEAIGEIRRVESEEGRDRSPIVALTAHAVSGYEEQCLEAGADDYASKPIGRAALARLVERWALHEDGGTDDSRTAVVEPKPDFDIDPDLADLVPGYITGCAEDLQRMGGLIEQEDFESVARFGHDLKGSGQAYGFPRVSELGAELERRARQGNAEEVRGCVRELADYIGFIQEALPSFEPLGGGSNLE